MGTDPAHKEFVESAKPVLEKVQVVDFVPGMSGTDVWCVFVCRFLSNVGWGDEDGWRQFLSRLALCFPM